MTLPPYEEALRWIDGHPDEDSSLGLAKLLLSLYDARCCFAFRECTDSLDDYRMALAVRVVQEFARLGEDVDLIDAGRAVAELYPELVEIAVAGNIAKTAHARSLQEPQSDTAAG